MRVCFAAAILGLTINKLDIGDIRRNASIVFKAKHSEKRKTFPAASIKIKVRFYTVFLLFNSNRRLCGKTGLSFNAGKANPPAFAVENGIEFLFRVFCGAGKQVNLYAKYFRHLRYIFSLPPESQANLQLPSVNI